MNLIIRKNCSKLSHEVIHSMNNNRVQKCFAEGRTIKKGGCLVYEVLKKVLTLCFRSYFFTICLV